MSGHDGAGSVRVRVNGDERCFDGPFTVAELVQTLDCGTRGVAVAVNAAVVPRSSWHHHLLADDDQVEILRAAQGG